MLRTPSFRSRPGFARLHCLPILTCLAVVGAPGTHPARAQDCVAPPSGLIGWWGTELGTADAAGHSDGQLINGASITTGLVGHAFNFDGNNDFVSIPDNPAFDFPAGNFTIEFWVNLRTVKTGSISQPGSTFVGHDQGQGFTTKWLLYHGEGKLIFAYYGPATGYQTMFVPCPLTASTWTHLALTRSGNTFTYYKNGIVLGTTANAQPLTDANCPLTIGQSEGLGFVDGVMDEVSLYSRALSQAELQSVFTAGNAGKCGPPIPPPPPGYSWQTELVSTSAGFGPACEIAEAGWLSFDASNNAIAAMENYNGCGGDPSMQWGQRTAGVWNIRDATGTSFPQGSRFGPIGFAALSTGELLGLKSGRIEYFETRYTYPIWPTPGPATPFRSAGLDCNGVARSVFRPDSLGGVHALEMSTPTGCGCHAARVTYDGASVLGALGYNDDHVGAVAVDFAIGPDGVANLFMAVGVPCNQATPADPSGLYMVRASGGTFSPLRLILPPPFWSSPNIAIDQYTGKMHLAVFNSQGPGGTKIMYYMSSTDNGQTWTTPVLVAGYADNPIVSINLAADGTPGISYWSGPGALRYAEPMCDGSWVTYDVFDFGGFPSSNRTRLAYDSGGKPNILYYNYPAQQWRLVTGTRSGLAVANAGPDQTVPAGSLVTLDATGSIGPANSAPRLSWFQVSGPAVTLNVSNPTHPTFSAPMVSASTALSFRLDVRNGGCAPVSDSVNVYVTTVPPFADAGPDQTVPEASLVTLDGSGSAGRDATPPSLTWTQTSGPAVSLNLGDPARPTFISPFVPASGALLTFRLDVADSPNPPVFDSVDIFVTNVNHPPIADAGPDQSAPEATLVMLDGSGTYDPDGDPISMVWTQIGGPAVSLDQTDPAHPTFTAPLVGPGAVTLTFQLDASDNLFAPSSDQVNVAVTNVNHPPVADAGPDQSVPEATLVTLDGSATYDADNDFISILWTQTAGPAVPLDQTDPLHSTFTAPYVGPSGATLVFRLDASDGMASPVSDAVTVTVNNVNHSPIADAGPDQSVPESTFVTLDGSHSFDPDNDPITYSWTKIAGPAVTLDQSDPVHPTFTAPRVQRGGATLTFRLDVSDGLSPAVSGVVNVTITNVNHPPVADAGPDQAVAEGSPVALNGSSSYDLDSEALTFEWFQVSGPLVYLDLADPAQPTFDAPAVSRPGDVISFILIVDDGIDNDSDTVNIAVGNVNHAPIARAGPDASCDEGAHVALDGSASSDPDNDFLAFAWEQFAGPAVILSDPYSPTPAFTAPQVGPIGATLAFRLHVDDGLDSASDDVTVFIRNTGTPPDCSKARPSQGELWPPNHKLVSIKIVGLDAGGSDPVTITITGVTQDEPLNGLGDGDTSPDAVLQGGNTVLLRAERSGTGNGRVYRIAFRAQNSAGQCTGGSVAVCVPHDQSPQHQCIDDGQRYNSLGK